MRKLLANGMRAIVLGLLLALLLAAALHGSIWFESGASAFLTLLTWLHVLSGIVWLGVLYYVNLMQSPVLPQASADLLALAHPGGALLRWSRWSALTSVITGLLLAGGRGYLPDVLSLSPGHLTMGIGMWLALIMALNVWLVIAPQQQKLDPARALPDAERIHAAQVALLSSRLNAALSLPMLYCMVAAGLLG